MSESAPLVPLDRIQWITGKLQDPTGRAFVFEGGVYRTVMPSAAERVRRMLDAGIVKQLVERGLLVPTEIAPFNVAGAAFVLKHRRAPFNTSAFEWCRPLLRDTALAWLDLNLALEAHGMATVDAHWGNFGQFGCCRPTWLDFGSISNLRAADQAISEFHQFFRNPLRLAAQSSGLARLVRGINHLGGLSDYEAQSLSYAALPGGRKIQNAVDRTRSAMARTRKRLGMKPSAQPASARRDTLMREREEIAALDFPKMKTTWGDYHTEGMLAGAVADLYAEPRRAGILRSIEKVNPKTAIDLAGNAGFYSVFTARRGAQVLSTDYDETACERFYELARGLNEPLELTTACADVTRQPFERPHLPRHAEMVLALALTHHLTLGQGYSFPSVIGMLARYTTDALLVEYMPNGLGGDVRRPDPLPDWYDRAIFENELNQRFASVELVTENKLPQWRALYLARGKR